MWELLLTMHLGLCTFGLSEEAIYCAAAAGAACVWRDSEAIHGVLIAIFLVSQTHDTATMATEE